MKVSTTSTYLSRPCSISCTTSCSEQCTTSCSKQRSTFSTTALFTSLILNIAITVALSLQSTLAGAAAGSVDGTQIGQLVNLSGDVKVRMPRQVRYKKAGDSTPFFVQEMLATHGAKSEASLSLESGAVIHLLGNARIVAEVDSNHDNSLIFTILNGVVELKKAAVKAKLHFFRDGREIEIKVGQSASLVPVVGRRSRHESAGNASAVVATTAEEIHPARPAAVETQVSGASSSSGSSSGSNSQTGSTVAVLPSSPSGNSNEKTAIPAAGEKSSRLTLGNDDISKQIKSQMSFFQRCYLNYLGRTTGDSGRTTGGSAAGGASGVDNSTLNLVGAKSLPPGTGPNGGQVVVLGFTIQNTGRVTQAHVVRADLADVTLQKCLTEVLGRTSFRSFAGDEIEVSEYPIVLQ